MSAVLKPHGIMWAYLHTETRDSPWAAKAMMPHLRAWERGCSFPYVPCSSHVRAEREPTRSIQFGGMYTVIVYIIMIGYLHDIVVLRANVQ